MRDRAYFQALLSALKETLSHLEEVKSFRHDDPELTHLKRALRGKIAEFESGPTMEFESSGAD